MDLDRLIQAGVFKSDLAVVDSHFTSIGITNMTGMVHLKFALVTLANIGDFERTVRRTYQAQPEPSNIIKPILKNLEFAKYLRNNFVAHIHRDLIAKAIEWQPILRDASISMHDPQAALMINLWLLETTINTYVDGDGGHKVFESETDLCYPPNWKRFLGFLETTVKGGNRYLEELHAAWAPKVLPTAEEPIDLELASKAGKTEFEFLRK